MNSREFALPGRTTAYDISYDQAFPARGDAKSLRTAEISNWSGKAIAAPRTELDDLLAREEVEKTGVYILIGTDPHTNGPQAYIGEAEVIRDRLRQHKTKEFWVSAIIFVSKDENLTKAHLRYLESRLLAGASEIGRFKLEQNQAGDQAPRVGPRGYGGFSRQNQAATSCAGF